MMRIPNRSQVSPTVCRRQIFDASLDALDRGYRRRQRLYTVRIIVLVLFVAFGSFFAGRFSNQVSELEAPRLVVQSEQPMVQPVSVQPMTKEEYLVLAEGGGAGFWQEKIVLTMRKKAGSFSQASGRTFQDWTQFSKQSSGDKL